MEQTQHPSQSAEMGQHQMNTGEEKNLLWGKLIQIGAGKDEYRGRKSLNEPIDVEGGGTELIE